MSEQFIPAAQTPTIVSNAAPTLADLPVEAKAGMEAARVAQDARMMSLLKKSAALQQFLHFTRIENSVQLDQAVEGFNYTKATLKEFEALLREYIDYPNMVVKLVRGMFKPPVEGVERVKAHLGGMIDVWRKAEEAKVARETAAAATPAGDGAATTVVQDGQEVVTFDAEPPAPPSNVITSARGAKVHGRLSRSLSVTDLKELLRAATSTNKRHGWLAENLATFVEIKTGTLLRLMDENKKRAVPGCELIEEKKTV